jgi:hypothetical protein
MSSGTKVAQAYFLAPDSAARSEAVPLANTS